MILPEMGIDLSAPETCFQAESAEECFVALKSWRDALLPAENMTLSSAVKAICCEEVAPNINHIFSQLSVLNMFTIVTGTPILF